MMASAGAAFDQQLRESVQQPFQQGVHPQDIAVPNLSLTVGRQRHTTGVGDASIDVPLEVRQLRLPDQPGHPFKQILLHGG